MPLLCKRWLCLAAAIVSRYNNMRRPHWRAATSKLGSAGVAEGMPQTPFGRPGLAVDVICEG